eukprot:352371-Chlamydomonas_euryale.AAC.5
MKKCGSCCARKSQCVRNSHVYSFLVLRWRVTPSYLLPLLSGADLADSLQIACFAFACIHTSYVVCSSVLYVLVDAV